MPVTQGSVFANRTIAPGVQTGELISDAPWWIYHSAGEPGTIRIWDGESDEPDIIANRHREAMFLRHSGLLKIMRTGLLEENGSRWCYALYEPHDSLLADLLGAGPASAEEAHDLALGLTGPLHYLHEQGLVYCHLDPRTVARKDGRWVLCDYSQLRLAGTGYASETRRLLARIPSAPPEAFDGHVSPAWDAWGLAHLTRAALLGVRTRRYSNERPPKADQLPEPFAAVIASCTAADPAARCTVSDIERNLRAHMPVTGSNPEPVLSQTPREPAVDQIATQRTQAAESFSQQKISSLPEVEHVPLQPRAPVVDRRNPALLWAMLGLVAALALLFVIVGGREKRNGPEAAKARNHRSVPAPGSQGTAAPNGAEMNLPDATEPDAATRGRTSEHAELATLVRSWASDFRQGDINGHLSHYAPKVERIFRRSDVDLNFVRDVKKQSLGEGNVIRRYDIENIRTDVQGNNRAVVTFDKTYEIAGKSPHSGKVRSELKLRRFGDGWRIVSERDAKVYWQKRS